MRRHLLFAVLLCAAALARAQEAPAPAESPAPPPDFSRQHLLVLFHESAPEQFSSDDTQVVEVHTRWGILRFLPLLLALPMAPSHGLIQPLVNPFAETRVRFPDRGNTGYATGSALPRDVRRLMRAMAEKQARENELRRRYGVAAPSR